MRPSPRDTSLRRHNVTISVTPGKLVPGGVHPASIGDPAYITDLAGWLLVT